MATLRPAAGAELALIAPAAVAAHVVADGHELAETAARAPWHVLASDDGDAAMLERWRTHTPTAAIAALWCPPRRVPARVRELSDLARSAGFDSLLSPLVPVEAVGGYVDGGMHVTARVLVMQRDLAGEAVDPAPPTGIGLRRAEQSDLAALVDVDRACFEPFWAFDLPTLERFARTGELLIATEDDRAVGYTLVTAQGAGGSLGRLAVLPARRGLGVGSYLARCALARMRGQNLRSATLCATEHNVGAQRLYRSLGFRELPGRLAFCTTDPSLATGDGERLER